MIQLSDDFRISFEVKDNVTLEQSHVVGDAILGKESKRKGETIWRQVGYHNTVRSAVKQYFELELRKSENIADLLARLDEIERQVDVIFAFRFSPFFTA
jgi:hypothetical protein